MMVSAGYELLTNGYLWLEWLLAVDGFMVVNDGSLMGNKGDSAQELMMVDSGK